MSKVGTLMIARAGGRKSANPRVKCIRIGYQQHAEISGTPVILSAAVPGAAKDLLTLCVARRN